MPFLPPRVGLPATIFVLLTSSLSAQTFGQIGERAQGMGGAFVAVADDASAIYWNPAGLATGAYFDAQLGFTSQSKATFAGAAMPAFAVGYYGLHTGVSSSGSRQNEGSGELHVADLTTRNVGVSFVQTIVRTLVIGSTLRLVKASDKSVFDLDAGAMVSVGNLRIGLTARNLRQPEFVVPERSDPIVLKRQARMGVAFVPRSAPAGVQGPFSLAFDADLTKTLAPFGDNRRAAVGSEQWWATGRVGTRLGVQWSTLDAARPAISGGVTVRLPRSSYAEGHVTQGEKLRESGWGAGLRVTF